MNERKSSAEFTRSGSSGRHTAASTHQQVNPPPGTLGLCLPVPLPGTPVPSCQSQSPTAGPNPSRSLLGTAVPTPSSVPARARLAALRHGPHSNLRVTVLSTCYTSHTFITTLKHTNLPKLRDSTRRWGQQQLPLDSWRNVGTERSHG